MVENYLPISIFCKLSLVLERILFDFVYPMVKRLTCRQQHGFMNLRSTVTEIIGYLVKIYKSQDNSSSPLSVYFDIRKAFDVVPHHLLLSQLQVLGFCPGFIAPLESYLSNCVQCIKVNDIFSPFWIVTSVVPQGIVLGPLRSVLFTMVCQM